MARRIPTPRKVMAVLPPSPPGLEPGEIADLVREPRATVSTACQRLHQALVIRRSARRDRRGRWRYWLPTSHPRQAEVDPEQR